MQQVSNLRSNPLGDVPEVHPSAYVDPTAQLIGKIKVQENVFIAPNVVIRSDEPGPEGNVEPVIVGAGTNIQDGVIVHSRGGTSVVIGARSTLAHGVIIHGPSKIGPGCFLGIRSVIYTATLEDGVWVGIGAIVMRAEIPFHTMIPAGSVVGSKEDVNQFRVTNHREQNYHQEVWEISHELKDEYLELMSRNR